MAGDYDDDDSLLQKVYVCREHDGAISDLGQFCERAKIYDMVVEHLSGYEEVLMSEAYPLNSHSLIQKSSARSYSTQGLVSLHVFDMFSLIWATATWTE